MDRNEHLDGAARRKARLSSLKYRMSGEFGGVVQQHQQDTAIAAVQQQYRSGGTASISDDSIKAILLGDTQQTPPKIRLERSMSSSPTSLNGVRHRSDAVGSKGSRRGQAYVSSSDDEDSLLSGRTSGGLGGAWSAASTTMIGSAFVISDDEDTSGSSEVSKSRKTFNGNRFEFSDNPNLTTSSLPLPNDGDHDDDERDDSTSALDQLTVTNGTDGSPKSPRRQLKRAGSLVMLSSKFVGGKELKKRSDDNNSAFRSLSPTAHLSKSPRDRSRMLKSPLFSDGDEIAQHRNQNTRASGSISSATSESDSEMRGFVSIKVGSAPTEHALSNKRRSRSRFRLPRSSGRASGRSSPRGQKAPLAPLFGVDLEPLLANDQLTRSELTVPYIMYFLCCQIIQNGGHSAEGIFRLSISSVSLEEYIQKLNERNYSFFDGITDPNVYAVLLKHLLRNLPVPLIPVFEQSLQIVDLYQSLPRAAIRGTYESLEEIIPVDCIELFDSLWNQLSDVTKEVLRFLFTFLETFVEREVIRATRMTLDNLALVFQNGIVRDPDDSPAAMLASQPKIQEFVSLFFYFVVNKYPLPLSVNFELRLAPPLEIRSKKKTPRSARLLVDPEGLPRPWGTWKEFLMCAGIGRSDSAHYSRIFKEEEMDINDWEEMGTSANQQLMRSFGVKAGHCVKIKKFANLEVRGPTGGFKSLPRQWNK